MWLAAPLRLVARHARACLVLGLLAGLTLPDLALALRPWLPEMISALLFFTAYRIGLRKAAGGLADAHRMIRLVLVMQLALPLLVLLLVTVTGLSGAPFAFAVVLVLAAPPMTGVPNFTTMTGHDPAPALRQLVLGTVLFPLTALPVLWWLTAQAGALSTVAHLIAVILLAVGAGFAVRALTLPEIGPRQTEPLDGMAALLLVVVAIALMSAISPMVRADPLRVVCWIAGVMGFNLVMQVGTHVIARRLGLRDPVPLAICAGNRNAALFLIALPPEVTGPLLIFVGCYQIPMYLTPILLRRLYRNDVVAR